MAGVAVEGPSLTKGLEKEVIQSRDRGKRIDECLCYKCVLREGGTNRKEQTTCHTGREHASLNTLNKRRNHSPLSLFSITSTVSPALRLISEFSCLS